MKCTIKEIALELGMSRNTVAKVLSGKSGVSPKTKTLVLEKAREMHYQFGQSDHEQEKSASAQEHEESHNSILFLTRTSFNYSDFWIKVMKGIETVLKENNYNLVLGVMDDQDIQRLNFPNIIHHSDIKGIILVELCEQKICNEVLKFHLPTVTLDMPKNYMHFLDKMDIITMENKIHIRQITASLIRKGCRRFAFAGNLSGNNVSRGFQERYEALCETLAENQLSLVRECCFFDETDQLFLNSAYIVNKLKSFSELPEVYICGNDWTAIQLINALQLLNYRIPQDVSVVGFDDIQAATKIKPALTTIRTDKEYLGIASANCILNRIRNAETPFVYAQYMTKLILRDSTL